MDTPYIIRNSSFQNAWKDAVIFLSANNWEYWNLIVQITNTSIINEELNKKISEFATLHKLIKPKDVAYTIFPFKQYYGKCSSENLYNKYINRFYPWTRNKPHSNWGTYFHRMIAYGSSNENQLKNIINAIKRRETQTRCGFSIIIQYPGKETTRYMGGPCLNYVTIQIETSPFNTINLLAVYRNHDFVERAYGNYWGLSELLKFMAIETDFKQGSLTCISSHAYITNHKRDLINFIGCNKFE